MSGGTMADCIENQIEEYRRMQQARFRGRSSYDLEDADFALAMKIQEEEEEEEAAKLKDDEDLAKRLQEELNLEEVEPSNYDDLGSEVYDKKTDEYLARKFQMEELETAQQEGQTEISPPIIQQQQQQQQQPMSWNQPVRSQILQRHRVEEELSLGRLPRLMDTLLEMRGFHPRFLPQERPEYRYSSPLRDFLRRRRQVQREREGFVVPFGDLTIDSIEEQEAPILSTFPSFGFTVPDDYESLLNLSETLGTVNRGASQESLEALPVRKYHKESDRSGEHSQCGICLGQYEENEEIRTLRCLHYFHKTCCDKWLQINKICPVCREDIE